MTLKFTNIVKAQITQTLLSTLFERGGYRVTRLGIEELFSEIKQMELGEYSALKLPHQLRLLPDLLVADYEMKSAYLVEVKYRAKFDDVSISSLCKELHAQRNHWPESYAVIMIADPFHPKGKFHQDYIRVLLPSQTDILGDGRLAPEDRWNLLPKVQDVFKKLDETILQYHADSITPVLRMLSSLKDKL